MLINSNLTVYHKKIDESTRLEVWERHNYYDIWWFGGKGAGINRGYDNANDVEIRIFYKNNLIEVNDFAIGDIIVMGDLDFDIETQQDLKQYETYNITSIVNNFFGNNPHLHIGGK